MIRRGSPSDYPLAGFFSLFFSRFGSGCGCVVREGAGERLSLGRGQKAGGIGGWQTTTVKTGGIDGGFCRHRPQLTEVQSAR